MSKLTDAEGQIVSGNITVPSGYASKRLNSTSSFLFLHMSTAVKMVNITKTFPGITANDNVNFEVKKGEVHGLLGENGAGKTVLMSILYGMYKPDKGQIFVNEKEVKIDNSAVAIKLGIGMVHQHFMLVPSLTVAENIVLGREPKKYELLLDIKKTLKDIEALSDALPIRRGSRKPRSVTCRLECSRGSRF